MIKVEALSIKLYKTSHNIINYFALDVENKGKL
jgi:hypothetical protein